jgi:hypothetical protein
MFSHHYKDMNEELKKLIDIARQSFPTLQVEIHETFGRIVCNGQQLVSVDQSLKGMIEMNFTMFISGMIAGKNN